MFWGCQIKFTIPHSKPFGIRTVLLACLLLSIILHIMESITISISVPNLRTVVNKAIYWASRCLQWRQVEISDHNRGITTITATVHRAAAPAATALRHRAQLREINQPSTISILWTGRNNTTTNLAVWLEHY